MLKFEKMYYALKNTVFKFQIGSRSEATQGSYLKLISNLKLKIENWPRAYVF